MIFNEYDKVHIDAIDYVDMVTMVTINNSNDEPKDDIKFRENLRSQLRQGNVRSGSCYENEGLNEAAEAYDGFVNMPFVSTALRWIGGIAGVFLLTFGLFWFLSFFGFVLPWYSAFSIFIMIVGGSLIAAAIATRKRR